MKLDIFDKTSEAENRIKPKLLLFGGAILLISSIVFHELLINFLPILILISVGLIAIGYVLTFMPNDKKVGQIELLIDEIRIYGSKDHIYTKTDIKEIIYYKGEHYTHYHHGSLMEYLNKGVNDYIYIQLINDSLFFNVHVPKQKMYNKIKTIIRKSIYNSHFDIISSSEKFAEILKDKKINKFYS